LDGIGIPACLASAQRAADAVRVDFGDTEDRLEEKQK
jgi:hypothetical protein